MWPLMVMDGRDAGIVADGKADDTGVLEAALVQLADRGGGVLELPNGVVRCSRGVPLPNADGVRVRGQGAYATRLDFSASTTGGLFYRGRQRVFGGSLEEMTIQGGGAASGIGIDLADWGWGNLIRLRVLSWETCLRLTSTASGGAHHNVLTNCRITNGKVAGVWLTGPQGTNHTTFHDGEISICDIGLIVDAPTGQTNLYGVSFESDALAIHSSGERGKYQDIRLEGNRADVHFSASSGYNVLSSGYFDPEKYQDISETRSNRVLPHGQAASRTERVGSIYLPGHPLSLAMMPLRPGPGMAVSLAFEVYEGRRVERIAYIPTAQIGSVDIGLCDADGTVLTSSGPTRVGPADLYQSVPFSTPKMLGPGRKYFAAILFDNPNAGFWGVKASPAGYALSQDDVLARQKQLQFPIGGQDAVSRGSGTVLTPALRLS